MQPKLERRRRLLLQVVQLSYGRFNPAKGATIGYLVYDSVAAFSKNVQ